MTFDKHMAQLYRELVLSSHTSSRLLANHIDDFYRTSEAVSIPQILDELEDELDTIKRTLKKITTHLSNYRKERQL